MAFDLGSQLARIRAKSSAGVIISRRSLACTRGEISNRSRSLVTRKLALPERAVAIMMLS